jgi:hypothetical protein
MKLILALLVYSCQLLITVFEITPSLVILQQNEYPGLPDPLVTERTTCVQKLGLLRLVVIL